VKLCCLILACLAPVLNCKAAGAAACHDQKGQQKQATERLQHEVIIHKVAGCHGRL